MSKSVLIVAAVAALALSTGAVLAADGCSKNLMTTQTPAPETVVDSTGTPPQTPIPPTAPTSGG
jgi:hypothetical protein